jgi:RimJ/RimL family protein N-acetyltransferase
MAWYGVDILTPNLVLHPYTELEAARVVRGTPVAGDVWDRDYPLEEEYDLLRGVLAERTVDGRVFGLYQIRRHSDGVVIGGIGFFGPPDEFQAVEIRFGIVPSATGHNFAEEAIHALVDVARENGALYLIASTTIGNVAAHVSLLGAGLTEVVRDDDLAHFAIELVATAA